MIHQYHRVDFDVDDGPVTVMIASDWDRTDLGTVQMRHKGKLVADICRLFVNPQVRRHGIASALLGECERIAKGSGCTGVSLLVKATNLPARALYAKEGFRTAYQYQDGDLLMSKFFAP